MDKDITQYFPARLSVPLSVLKCSDISEIRLRADRPLAVTLPFGVRYVTSGGGITDEPSHGITVLSEEIHKLFDAACQYSLHSYHNQIAGCFVTLPHGHRLGISGTAVMNGDKTETVRDISSVCFRIARQIYGAADDIMRSVMNDGLHSIIICGRPAGGKTTILRDLCRQLGDRHNVSLIDERNEIAAGSRGHCYSDVGANTDVFSGFSKAEGISTALRVMSPSVIICDEIGSETDAAALENAYCCGVKLAATAHGGSIEEIFRRKHIGRLIDMGLFEYAAFAESGRITKIIKIGECGSEICGDRSDIYDLGNDRKLSC